MHRHAVNDRLVACMGRVLGDKLPEPAERFIAADPYYNAHAFGLVPFTLTARCTFCSRHMFPASPLAAEYTVVLHARGVLSGAAPADPGDTLCGICVASFFCPFVNKEVFA